MIDIKALRKGQRIIRHWPDSSEDTTSEFIITSVIEDPENGWIAEADWVDDDYTTTIYEVDQDKYEYGRRRRDLRPKRL